MQVCTHGSFHIIEVIGRGQVGDDLRLLLRP
ncbi:hypothetical protein X548_01425 [Stenotrophomonas maltophilia 5BA-I-2]|nr:hypothetical protein X548_01425 [Stenotrophomonas maltophilia 5BA-I-2]